MNSMRKKILEHSARYTAILFGLWRPLVCHVQDIISESRKLSWEDLRSGFTLNFVMTLLILAMLTYFIWGFDHIDRLYDSIVMNLLPAYFPPAAFYQAMRQKPEARRFDWWYAGFAFFLGLALLLAISDRYDFHELGINVVVVMTSAPWLFIFGMLVRGKRILAIGMVPAAILLMGYWVAPVISEGSELQYFLIPLPAVSILLAAWTFLVWASIQGRRQVAGGRDARSTYGEPSNVVLIPSNYGPCDMGSQGDSGWRGLVRGACSNGRRCVWQRDLGAANTFLAELRESPIGSCLRRRQ